MGALREWSRANGGPVGLIVVGIPLALALWPLGVALIVIGAAWFLYGVSPWEIRRKQEGKAWAVPAELTAHHIQGRSLRIADLVSGSDNRIRNRTFDDCDIYGPALLIGKAGMFVRTGFSGTPESTFWEVPESRIYFDGAILIEDCMFRGCRLVNIGLVGSKKAIAEWHKGFGPQP